MDVRVDVGLHDLADLESFPNKGATVLLAGYVLHDLHQVEELDVILVLSEGKNRNAVINLVREGDHGVIDDDNVLETPAFKDPEIFYEESVVVGEHLHARISEQPVLDQLSGGVENIKDRIRVVSSTCREYYHLEVFVGLLQALDGVRPNVESNLQFQS